MDQRHQTFFLALVAAIAVCGRPAQGTESVLHSFANAPRGSHPQASLIRDSAGSLYGTTSTGGTANLGVAFKVDTNGKQTVLHSFAGGADGATPTAALTRDAAGNLYGTTFNGGSANAGVIFKISPAGVETVLYNFTGGADGGNPYAGVIRAASGNIYGTTYQGGASHYGVFYKLDANGHQTVLHSFTGGADGGAPYAGVIPDATGNFYGTTSYGGTYGSGVIYRMDPNGTETVLYNFTGQSDGGRPYAGVIFDSAGNLYGTSMGETGPEGVVYKLDASGHFTPLHGFNFTDGSDPYGGVVRDSAGNLYGTTFEGGTASWGVVFKVDAAGNYSVLYNFTGGPDGGQLYGGVILDSAGNLYGTTYKGGTNWGVVFKVDTTSHESVLYAFTGGPDGTQPQAGVVRDSAGNLYGTTYYGGASNAGMIYKLDSSGHETVLYDFTGGADGKYPYAGVTLDASGNLYGTTLYGGAFNAGVVYKLDSAGRQTVLHTFTGGTDGNGPYGGVILDAAGNLYGTTVNGGATGGGVVFVLDPSGNETVLHSFTLGADGGFPEAGVVRDPAGNLYGTTCRGGIYFGGVVYKLNPAGNLTVLYSFSAQCPNSNLILDPAGNLYGVVYTDVYKLDQVGHQTILYDFVDSGIPTGPLIRDPAGNLYGTANYAGTTGAGIVYKVTPSGKETDIYDFTGGNDGAAPLGGVTGDSAGNLYGTTSAGGKTGGGVVFKVTTR